MKSLIGSSIAVTLIVGSPLFVSQTQEVPQQGTTEKSQKSGEKKPAQKKKRKADTWMKAKKDHSHDIFDGLIAGDFRKIENASLKMMGNNILERWLADRKDYENSFSYHGQLNAFDYSTRELWRFAKQKDMDGALQAYGVMSRSCVRCHYLIRDGVVPPDTLKDIAMKKSSAVPFGTSMAKLKDNEKHNNLN